MVELSCTFTAQEVATVDFATGLILKKKQLPTNKNDVGLACPTYASVGAPADAARTTQLLLYISTTTHIHGEGVCSAARESLLVRYPVPRIRTEPAWDLITPTYPGESNSRRPKPLSDFVSYNSAIDMLLITHRLYVVRMCLNNNQCKAALCAFREYPRRVSLPPESKLRIGQRWNVHCKHPLTALSLFTGVSHCFRCQYSHSTPGD